MKGTDVSFGIGISPHLLPFSAGSFVCETVLDRVMIEPDEQDLPRIPARPSTVVANSVLRIDLEGGFDSDPSLCSRSDDDVSGGRSLAGRSRSEAGARDRTVLDGIA